MRSVSSAFALPLPPQADANDRDFFESVSQAFNGNDNTETDRRPATISPERPRIPGAAGPLLERMEDAPAEEIVRKLEEAGIYTFTGDNAEQMRETVIDVIDKSKFLKRFLVDAINRDAKSATTKFEFANFADDVESMGLPGRILVGGDLDADAQQYLLAHEMFHTFGLEDAADMVQAMDVFVAESGVPERSGAEGAEPTTAPDVDYDLYRATLDDWKAAGLLGTNYDYDSPDMKDAMERFFGPSGRDRNPYEAFSESAQRFDGDREKIIQAYIDAKDGGRVEALRAEQLREMGVSNEELEELAKPPSPLEGMEMASGKDIVARLEEEGLYTFTGDGADKLRQAIIECIDRSPFFKRSLIDATARDVENTRRTFEMRDLPDNTRGQVQGQVLTIEPDLTGDDLLYVMAHEAFHTFGIHDAADMVQSMDVFVAESKIKEGGFSGAAPVTPESVDYDLYRATLDDWNAAGALRQEDYYDNSKPELKDAMERIFGRSGRDYDPNQAFADSCQSFDGDRERIIQAYIDAKDGGKVEALRAEQLRELGINPDDLKNITELADWYVDNISIERREVGTADSEFPKEKIAVLSDFYRNNINKDATEGEIADWIMGQLEFRVENGFDGDGAEAREILHNHFVKHGGRETMMGIAGDFDATLNEAVDTYANGGIDSETRMLFGFKDAPINDLFKDMIRFFVRNIDPDASAEEAGMWAASQIRDRLGAATGEDKTKLEIFDNYVTKKNRSGRQDAIDVATEIFEEMGIDPKPELPVPMF